MLYPLMFDDILSLNENTIDVRGLNLTPVLAVNDFLTSKLPVLKPTSGIDVNSRSSLKPNLYAIGI